MLTEAYFKFMAIINSPAFLRGFFDNRFYLILLVIILTRFKYTTYRSMWMSALINIPGTLLHETMHYLVGLVLNARPCNFTVFPTRGNVTFYNAVPAAMAPLLLLPLGFYVNRHLLPLLPPTFVNYVLYVLLQTIIIENAVPSRADFRVAGMYITGVIMYLFLALLVFLSL